MSDGEDNGRHESVVAESSHRKPDAGLRTLHHYQRRLPRWRYNLRQRLIPIVRWETPYLASMQTRCRSPMLDTYFAFTANLGTHTFFMTFLPICFWFGYPDIGITLVHMLGLGVYLSGAVKDFLCLPRPLSPPLQRITMSGSAALEYGFPSTHTTNAVSVALFGLYRLNLIREDISATTYALGCLGCYCYATSITVGRMYCGMHGFFDVVVGGLLGAVVAWVRVQYGASFDEWVVAGSWTRLALIVVVLALAVRFHPEPADDCPCFDDSVAFLGVIMGVSIGIWHFVKEDLANVNAGANMFTRYNFATQDVLKSGARLVGGVFVVFLWRAVMKRLLLRSLPPVFRFVDHWGVRMPRRYFLQARDYKRVPYMRKDDNVIPSASDISSLVSSLGRPRKRRVSVGPQSEADAREYLANRAQRRQDRRRAAGAKHEGPGNSSDSMVDDERLSKGFDGGAMASRTTPTTELQTLSSSSSSYLQINKSGTQLPSRTPSNASATSESGREEARSYQRMFETLEQPRTHYDVEVITKLVVYAGIAWLAVEGNPLWFEKLGLT